MLAAWRGCGGSWLPIESDASSRFISKRRGCGCGNRQGLGKAQATRVADNGSGAGCVVAAVGGMWRSGLSGERSMAQGGGRWLEPEAVDGEMRGRWRGSSVAVEEGGKGGWAWAGGMDDTPAESIGSRCGGS